MTMNTIERIKQTNDLRADNTLEKRRHFEQIDASRATQETILKAIRSLVSYLDNPQRVTKTTIVNQLKSVGTPDALKVAEAVRELHATVKTHKNTDLSEVASLLKRVLAEAQKIPKSHNEIKIPSAIDHTEQFNKLEAALQAVDKSIKAQELKVEAPVINLEKPDLSPLLDELKKIFDKKDPPVYKEPYELVNGAVPVTQANQLINFEFDRYEFIFDDFSEDPKIEAIDYFLGKKKTGTIKYLFTSDGTLKGARRA